MPVKPTGISIFHSARQVLIFSCFLLLFAFLFFHLLSIELLCKVCTRRRDAAKSLKLQDKEILELKYMRLYRVALFFLEKISCNSFPNRQEIFSGENFTRK